MKSSLSAPVLTAAPLRADEGTDALISASEAYPRLEDAVLAAEREVLLGFRVLDPETRLRSATSSARGLATWADLIADAVARGLVVRILLTDFEPVVANDLHQKTWKSVQGFRARSPEASDGAGSLRLIAALHEGEFGPFARRLFWPLVRLQLRRLLRRAAKKGPDVELVERSPGLRGLLHQRGDMVERRTTSTLRLYPATYHQKLAVIDAKTLIIGGLDINERRYDDHAHQRPADQTWHDVSLISAGAIASDARQHFVDCWNREVPRFNARLTTLGAPRHDLPELVEAMADETADAQSDLDTAGTLQLVRTLSRRSPSFFAFGPRTIVKEIEQAHLAQIAQCQRLLYIETQFFRSSHLAEALAAAGRQKRDLRLILVVPAAPEDVAFEGNGGIDARHGEWLQVQAIDLVAEAFGDRFAAYSLVRDASGEETGERNAVDGREIVYLHSKIAISDASSAIVSSANLNGRSLRWDTECGAVWTNPTAVEAFQARLWSAHLRDGFDGQAAPAGEAAFQMWKKAASEGPSPHTRQPLIAPYPLERARSFAKRVFFVPTNLL